VNAVQAGAELRSPLFRSLFIATVVLALLPLMTTMVASVALGRSAAASAASVRLRADAILLRESARAALEAGDVKAADALAKRLGKELATRFTIIDGKGVVLGDSDHDPLTMESHATRPEVTAAVQTGLGTSSRHSDTLGQEMFYVAVRADDAHPERGTVRAALPAAILEEQFEASLRNLALVAAPLGMIALAALGLTLLHVIRDLDEVTRVAHAVAQGTRLEPMRASDRRDEIGDLARSVHSMADELAKRVQTIEHERNELATIVTGMGEGLLAVDARTKLLLSNEAARRLLGAEAPLATGKDLAESVKHEGVVQVVREALSERKTVQRELEFVTGAVPSRQIEVRATPLADGDGAVVLLRDVTEAFHYERLRREFVANVSHELRTPITLVKGFLETLEDGALRDAEKGPRFLQIASRHVVALEALVEDLLTLGRLDAGAETRVPGPVSLRDVIDGVLAGFEELVRRKGLVLRQDVHDDVPLVVGHRDLVERALRNLVDNAIKYTDQGEIAVLARRDGERVLVTVADTGIGIPAADLPRIFERFYRVEKSRSREAGGTGLGLAIVKHIAQQEGGAISVESEVGKGSRFTLALRAAG
jgi:two-component system phosphate regulon sensor histidine kinase PhoR